MGSRRETGSRAAFAAIALALTASLLLGSAPAAASPRGWWDRDWSCRTRVTLREKQEWKGSPAAHVRLPTGGRARPDGADIRLVTRSGKEVPRAILARGPGDLYEVAFPAGREKEWFVYYGNPDASPPEEDWVPDRGLVLETRARGPGNPRDWPAMAEILKRSTAVHGGSLWPRVFDAENPFGPSDNFVSIYRGHILAPADGTYVFYTASDEASFLFVDGKLVVSWPGWHDARQGAWAKFHGTIQLAKGLHPFRYVHVERTGNQVMAAYWKPPGAPKAVVIPPTAFPGLLDVDIVGHEVRDKDVAASFTAQVDHKWGMDNRVYSGVTLKALLAGKDATYAWDFGDGVGGEGPLAYHVYLAGGDYDVSLTVTAKGESDTVTRTVRVPTEWTRFDRNREATLTRFSRIAATYPARSLHPLALDRLAFLLQEAGMTDELVAIEREAVERNPLLSERERFDLAMRLGEIYRDRKHDLENAIWAFRRASTIGKKKRKYEGQVALAEALLLLGGDPGMARKLLDQVIREVGPRAGNVSRRAYLRRGDALMLLGDGEGARADYGEASELAGGAEDAKRLLRKAAAARSAVTCLQNGDLDRARERLADWEWNAPEDRFTGLHRIVRAKYLVARSLPDDAIRELRALVDVNPESEYADQALFLLAGIEKDRGRDAEADAYLERLRKDYPWSPLAK